MTQSIKHGELAIASSDEIYAALRQPFKPNEVHWRVGATNKNKVRRETGDQNAHATKAQLMPYIDARDCMKRLDEVVGVNGWQRHHPAVGICELSLFIEDQWVVKTDVAGETDIEAEKGSASRAFVRACANFGLGRYLYYYEIKWHDLKDKWGNFDTPQLPDWALPKENLY